MLYKYKTTLFLKESIELLFHIVSNRNSAHLLAIFIANQLKTLKQHKFFLIFLKQILSILSKIWKIKVIIKGRLNGLLRATSKIITINNVPIQSITKKISHYQETIYNSNGSYGIKIWIVEQKALTKDVFLL